MTAVIDERGYFFALPSLGLPDPAGEWVTIKGAVGIEQQALPLVLNSSSTTTARMRSPGVDDKVMDVEYQGALWLLPLVAPRGKPNDPPEVFNVRVQRFLPSVAPDPARRKLDDNLTWVCLMPTEGMTAYLASLSTPASCPAGKTEGEHSSPAGSTPSTSGPAPSPPTTSRPKLFMQTQVRQEEEGKGRKGSDKWEDWAGESLDEGWCRSVMLKALKEFSQSDPSVSAKPVTILLREHPAWNGDFRSLDYTVVRVDEDASGSFGEHRWTPLPPGACKPGAERRLVNMAREKVRMRPFGEDEWPPGPGPCPW